MSNAASILTYLFNTPGWVVETNTPNLILVNDSFPTDITYKVMAVEHQLFLVGIDRQTSLQVSEPIEITELSQIPGFPENLVDATQISENEVCESPLATSSSIEETIANFLTPENHANGLPEKSEEPA